MPARSAARGSGFAGLELYHSRQDPEQKHDVAEEHPDTLKELRDMAVGFQQRPFELNRSRAVEPVTLDADDRERLRRLGYLTE